MESLSAYLSADGWKSDLKKTKEDFARMFRSKDNVSIDKIVAQRGQVDEGCLIGCTAAVIAMPFCALAGTYVGEFGGYVFGNIVNFIPLVRDVAPWCAERTGLMTDYANEDVYQVGGAVSGFWGGLCFPFKVLQIMFMKK